jgi:hypothetical protein
MPNIKLDEIVQDHEKRIIELEKNSLLVNNTLLKVENTLLTESRETRALLNKMIEKQFGLAKINLAKKWEFWFAIVGSGGILYAVLDVLSK